MTTTLTRRLFGASLAALSAAAMPGLVQAADKAAKSKSDKLLYKDAAQPIDARVKDLLARMTLEEKAKQAGHTAPAMPRLKVPQGQVSLTFLDPQSH